MEAKLELLEHQDRQYFVCGEVFGLSVCMSELLARR
jgi:hypothetical protein